MENSLQIKNVLKKLETPGGSPGISRGPWITGWEKLFYNINQILLTIFILDKSGIQIPTANNLPIFHF